ncbi:MAG: hydroxymethylbilane synthase, partial [Myxococcota bacterium]|nr:hydroxymethylbilane synthase [Myxococcota bacterium]
LEALPKGARVGTGSVRRTSQLRAWRPDLEVVGLRGNVETRLRKMEESLDAVILATSGLERLGLEARIRERVPPERLLPAAGQGTLALQVRADDTLAERLAALDHAPTRHATLAERAFLATLEGDCGVPLAALAEPVGAGRLRLRGLVARVDGREVVAGEGEDAVERAAELGRRVGEDVRARGGDRILREHLARGAR